MTTIDIRGGDFLINGQPTYPARTWNGHRIEGLLLNSRMVQATFDDLNPQTRGNWAHSDVRPFDADGNTDAFIAALPVYRKHGLLSVTLNFQGGSPRGYSREQPWINSAFDFETGALRDDYLARMGRVLDACDALGLAPIVGLLYFGQEPRFASEQVVVAAVDNATDWLLSRGYKNVLVEINNECDVRYRHEICKPPRVHELIRRVQQRSAARVNNAIGRLYVSTSMGGGNMPPPGILETADFVLLHGKGVSQPARIGELVQRVRGAREYRGQPVVYNEDDHFDFDQPTCNFVEAVKAHASWGYFDYRMAGETSFDEGYQSVPPNWQISSSRKRGFFALLKDITGGQD